MRLNRGALKRQAREDMRRPRPPFWAVTLAYLGMTSGVALAVSLIPTPASGSGNGDFFLMILLNLYIAVVDFGFVLWALWSHRRLDPDMGALVQSFSVAGRVIVMEISILVRVLLWSMVLAMILSFAVSPLVMLLLRATGGTGPVVALTVLAMLAGVEILLYVVSLRYALAPYLLADRPDDGPGAAVRRSVEMMRGWSWELFKLDFSFMGWELLALALSWAVQIACLWYAGFFQALPGIGAEQLVSYYYWAMNGIVPNALILLVTIPVKMWLLPYQGVTRAGFYDARLQAQQRSAPPL